MARKHKSGGSGPNWMDTYGDMVTLLLCFFVLLNSMSSIDAAKWEILVRSFNPSASKVSQIVINSEQQEEGNEATSQGTEALDEENRALDEFDELFYTLSQYVAEMELEQDVEVSQGDGFTFITFKNNIFFEGNSYVLRDEGKEVLDYLAGAMELVSDSIGEVQIMGHTSQASPDVPNEITSDRFLSSNRATVVLVYLQEKNMIDPAKLVSQGYGQFRPISPFDTYESRAKNRRVEILITKEDSVLRTLDEYYQEAYNEEVINIETGSEPSQISAPQQQSSSEGGSQSSGENANTSDTGRGRGQSTAPNEVLNTDNN